MQVTQAIRTKRAVRQFTADPIPDQQLVEILNAGRRAQSAKNRQPWHFMAVRDRGTLKALSKLGTYADQLAEILSSQEDQSLPLETFLSSGGRGDMELTEKILDEDYLSQRNLNSILNELNLEELKRLEESIKTLQIGDIL